MTPIAFVDTHHHFQDVEHHYYPWLCDPNAPPKLEGDLTPLRRNYLLADYLDDLHDCQPVKSVHVQNGWDPRDPVGETRWLQEQADRHAFPHAIVAYADLAAPDVGAILEAHCRSPNVRGIRQILNWDPDPVRRVASRADLMTDRRWREGFALLRSFRLSFDLQIYWPQMADALALANAFPETTIILNHFGMPIDRSGDGIDAWQRALAMLAAAPNVMVKLSGLGLGHPAWTTHDTVPLLLRTVGFFGVERCMFASNLPVERLFAPPAAALAALAELAEHFSAAEQRQLWQANAELVYRI